MLKTFFRAIAAGVIAISMCVPALPARADGTPDLYEQVILPGANTAIKNAMDEARRQRDAQREATKRQAAAAAAQASGAPATGDASVLPPAPYSIPGSIIAQAPPVSQQPVSTQVGLPTGFTYTADITSAYPFGNIGTYGKAWLMGGFDASIAYGFNPTTRVVASLYQLQHYPYGFNSGLTPVYLQGFRNPVGCADLSGGTACGPGTGENLNVRTKDTFGVFMLEKMVFPLEHAGLPLPIVISPTYVARGGNIGASPVFNDQIPFTYNLPDGPLYTNLATRTAQYKAVALTMPFLKTPKMFGTFTLAPQWLVHTAGANSKNAMQLPQVVYLEYTPARGTTIFFEPQSARDYLPTDPYPEHLIAYFLGISQHLTKYSFAQIVLNSGQPTNMGPDGVIGIKCLTVAICAPAIGGLKATQIQFQLGLGSPNVFPL